MEQLKQSILAKIAEYDKLERQAIEDCKASQVLEYINIKLGLYDALNMINGIVAGMVAQESKGVNNG